MVDVDVARRAGWTPVDLARAYLDGGARLLQIRAKQLGSGPFLELCDAVVNAGSLYGALVIVNDRADLAGMSGAAGVHVGQEDLPPAMARQLLGRDAIVGVSTHSVSQIAAVVREPISYIAVGPVFGTHTKDTGYHPVGLDLVSTAVRLAEGTPVVAIGGITLENAKSVLDAGAASVAVIRDLLATHDPAGRTLAYLQRLAQHRV
ncbi:MAG TPA: thiamine phosphate synthase [Vicinamibacterales bacterium]|nr:thiamine phosphate synthase [Vicinamibacterales bacterium]